MCICSPESQPDTVLHIKKHSQQFEGGDSPLFHSGEIPAGILLLASRSPEQERHGHVKADTEEGHKNDQRVGIPLL